MISGQNGSVYIGATAVGELNGWEYNGTMGTMKGSSLSSNYTKTDPTYIDGSGTLRMKLSHDDAGQALLVIGAEPTLNLFPDADSAGNLEYTTVGNENGDVALITSVRITHSDEAYAEYEVGFERPLLRTTISS